AAPWSSLNPTRQTGNTLARGRSATKRHRPPQAIQNAWSGRANQPTPITSLPIIASSLGGRCARRHRPLVYRWIDISTKNAAPKSLASLKSDHGRASAPISAGPVACLPYGERLPRDCQWRPFLVEGTIEYYQKGFSGH